MGKYRVELDDKKVVSVQPTEHDTTTNDTFLEERTGETIYAVIEASDDAEAAEKAERLQTQLQTRIPKDSPRNSEDR